MANLTNPVKRKLELLFGMQTGYVMDFTNATFADFVETSIGLRVYDEYSDGDSKARILRSLWKDLDNARASALIRELIDYWEDAHPLNGIDPSDAQRVEAAREALDELDRAAQGSVDPADLAFLEKDLGTVDLAAVRVPLEFHDIVKERLAEIKLCMEAQAPLAVIFLCGSTLEGLLAAIAYEQPLMFSPAKSAPKRGGKTKPFQEWSLSDLIVVSHERGLIGVDVVKFAHAVRDFRNYIHPRQQLLEN